MKTLYSDATMAQQKAFAIIPIIVLIVRRLFIGNRQNSVDWMLKPAIIERIICVALDDGAEVIDEIQLRIVVED